MVQKGVASSFWSVGDTRTESVRAVTFEYNTHDGGYSTSQKNEKLRIVGFNIDGSKTMTVASSTCLVSGPFRVETTWTGAANLGDYGFCTRLDMIKNVIFGSDCVNVMKSVNKCAANDGCQNCNIFMPSITELGLASLSNDGSAYPYFSSNSSRSFGETACTRSSGGIFGDEYWYGVSRQGTQTKISLKYEDTGFSQDAAIPILFVVG